MKIVFFGTPQIAADVLSFLLDEGVEVAAVITKPDRPKGRSGKPLATPVKSVALSQNPPIPVYQPELVSASEFAATLEPYEADLFIVVAYGEIIKQHLLDMPRLGCVNLHASLLPKYRGAAPIQRAIINGERETGVTVMHMVKKMDAGDMIKRVVIPIDDNMTAGELERLICEIGSKALLDVIREFEKGTVSEIPQDHEQATFAPKLELEDCEVVWENPALALHNLVRGSTPYPGAWCYVFVKGEKKRLKIIKSRLVLTMEGLPGKILSADKEGVVIACKERALKLLEVQLEGKKAMPAADLLRGTPLFFEDDGKKYTK